MTPPSPADIVKSLGTRALEASRAGAILSPEQKTQALQTLLDVLLEEKQTCLEANREDLRNAPSFGLSDAMQDRLRLTPKRYEAILESVRSVIALPDPVGEVIESRRLPNDLHLERIRVPIGVIGIIYESRPNVTIDCAILCLKSGNATILRGGKEAFHTNSAFAHCINRSLLACGLPEHLVQLVPTTDREAVKYLLQDDAHVHCIIPRGGEGLVRFVAENARMPVLKHYTGVCSVYIDKAADPIMAQQITTNSKCQRPSVCNAAENLFIHRDNAHSLLPPIARDLVAHGVTLLAHDSAAPLLQQHDIPFQPATEEDFFTEFLDLRITLRIVHSTEEAIRHIHHYGSGHSDAIVTRDEETARQFLRSVDSAAVYWNASTRFTDGFEFGLGAEIGISTDRLHARGPVGLRELTTYKYQLTGNGQIRTA